jgi:3-phenylpropionate/cinnamic acid dioxygenase small subunit
MNTRNATFTVQDLSDRAQIEDVLNRYTTALDTKDWALLETTFSEQPTADYSRVGGPSQPLVSPTAIAGLLKATLGTLITQHISSNALIELSGDSATVVSYLLAQHWRKSDGVEFTTRGRYVDTFVREASGWRIKTRLLDPIHTTGNPAIFGS